MPCVSKLACTHVIIISLWLTCHIQCGFSISIYPFLGEQPMIDVSTFLLFLFSFNVVLCLLLLFWSVWRIILNYIIVIFCFFFFFFFSFFCIISSFLYFRMISKQNLWQIHVDGAYSQSGLRFVVWNFAGYVLLRGILCHQFCSWSSVFLETTFINCI